jgi:hypothetical protein
MERGRALEPAEPRWIFPPPSVVGAGKRSWCIPSGLRASLARRSAPISPKAAEAGLVSCSPRARPAPVDLDAIAGAPLRSHG